MIRVKIWAGRGYSDRCIYSTKYGIVQSLAEVLVTPVMVANQVGVICSNMIHGQSVAMATISILVTPYIDHYLHRPMPQSNLSSLTDYEQIKVVLMTGVETGSVSWITYS